MECIKSIDYLEIPPYDKDNIDMFYESIQYHMYQEKFNAGDEIIKSD